MHTQSQGIFLFTASTDVLIKAETGKNEHKGTEQNPSISMSKYRIQKDACTTTTEENVVHKVYEYFREKWALYDSFNPLVRPLACM